MRNEFLEGRLPMECQRCGAEEAAGFRSHRQWEIENSRYSVETLKDHVAGPKLLVIRISNICNLACRTCHSVDSSYFKLEGDFYASIYGDLESRYVQRDQRRQFHQVDMEHFLGMTNHLEELHFYGGEPLLNVGHLFLLERLAETGDASRISLFYCTNGTVRPTERHLDLWKRFNNVHLHFSIDGIKASYDYLRWPARWSETYENLLHCQHVLSKKFPLSCGANVTVSSMNVYRLPEIFSTLTQVLQDSVNLTTVHDPDYFSVVHLPKPVKLIVAEELRRSTYQHQFQGLVSYMLMHKQNPDVWRNFVLWTEKMDAYRGQRFANAFPVYFEILRPYFVPHASGFHAVRRG